MSDHPGHLLREMLRTRPESQAELADMCGVSRFTINQIVGSRRAITPYVALRLEHVGYGEADDWVVLQARHDLALARNRAPDG